MNERAHSAPGGETPEPRTGSKASLAKQIARGGAWTLLLQLSARVVGLLNLFVVAHLLSPLDFGLIGVALIALSALDTLTTTGIDATLLQHASPVEPLLDTAWTLRLLRNLAQALVLVLAAPAIAAFFREPALVDVLRVMALTLLGGGLANIGTVRLERNLAFDRIFRLELMVMASTTLVVIVLAFLQRDVWALVWGAVFGSAFHLVASYFFLPHWPRLRIDRTHAATLYRYGRWLLLHEIFTVAADEGDDVVVGRILGTGKLGVYRLAYRIANLPGTEIAGMLDRILFPVYGRLQNHPDALRQVLRSGIRIGAYVTLPATAGIVILAPEMAQHMLGTQWLEIVPVVRALSAYVLIRVFLWLLGTFLLATGEPRIQVRLAGAQVALFAVLILPLTVRWGLLGAVASLAVAGFVVAPWSARIVARKVETSVLGLFHGCWVPVLTTGLMAGLLAPMPPSNSLIHLALKVAVSAAVYLALTEVLGRGRGFAVREMLHVQEID